MATIRKTSREKVKEDVDKLEPSSAAGGKAGPVFQPHSAHPAGNTASALESWLSQGHWLRSKDIGHKLGQLETASPLVTLTGPKMDA